MFLGLQLVRSSDKVSLKLFGRSFGFTTGIMSVAESEAVDSKSQHGWDIGGRPELNAGNSFLTQTTNYNFKFRMSDEKFDAGQSFVPYFDSTAISFDLPAPLSSIGLSRLRNDHNYAGFVRPTIKSLDYTAFRNEFENFRMEMW